MGDYGIGLVAWLMLLAVAVPFVARIRHPDQKPLAAYLIFVTVFGVAAIVLFSMLGWFAILLGFGAVLENTGPALVLTALALLPAVLLAIWQTGKPPLRRGPPN